MAATTVAHEVRYLSNDEAAKVLGISGVTAKRYWRHARAWRPPQSATMRKLGCYRRHRARMEGASTRKMPRTN